MLISRLVTAIPLVLAFLAILFVDVRLDPWFPLWLLASLVVLLMGGNELVDLLGATSARPSRNAVLGGVVAVGLANWIPHLLPSPSPTGYDPSLALNVLAWPFLAFVAFVMSCFIAQSLQFVQPGRTMAALSGTLLAVAYVGLLGSFLIQFRWLEGPGVRGLVPLAALVATAKGSDTGAYTLGRLAGRHKLWPRLSPNKTVEGAIGGLIFAVAGAALVFVLARTVWGETLLGWPAILGFGLVVGAFAQLGDLMESMIKRDCAQKDASHALPGFGGILDVIDSLLFSAPVAYGYWLAVA